MSEINWLENARRPMRSTPNGRVSGRSRYLQMDRFR